ncbi:PREDICTED: uncharacterized protein LOC105949464 [Erythranthe guttata]|uniref:uncharacterized protein LOC105949464 n=1 Tax=Erythranthe guttata TaxID=4155 RepID=UPI00064D8271|nr:PREDICTED: uncharacterized protein LOC105949464 [Erythranthe guttata]|eukprot:XP_012828230.1 PREDICTED: uncharacterized protein LOC105949464 [Erythranthe guttata]
MGWRTFYTLEEAQELAWREEYYQRNSSSRKTEDVPPVVKVKEAQDTSFVIQPPNLVHDVGVDEVEEEIVVKVKSSVAIINDDINEINVNIDEVEGTVNELEASINKVEESDNGVEDNVSKLKEEVDEFKEGVTSKFEEEFEVAEFVQEEEGAREEKEQVDCVEVCDLIVDSVCCEVLVSEKLVEPLEFSIMKPIFLMPRLEEDFVSESFVPGRLVEHLKLFAKKYALLYFHHSSRLSSFEEEEIDNERQIGFELHNNYLIRRRINFVFLYVFYKIFYGLLLLSNLLQGPYTLTEHEELTKNTIKALCNADVSQWIFVSGKDVSLPETIMRNPRKFLKGLGGRRVSQRPILAFFAGNNHGRVRPILIKNWSEKDRDMRIYGPLPNKVSRVMSYSQHMKSSKYCICPMGFEVNSPRIVEAIYYECVPVIIADNFIPPLNDVLNWNAFSVIVAENDIPKLKQILLAIPLRQYLIMQTNIKRLKRHFLWNVRPIRYDLFHMILHSIWYSRINQIQIPHPY